jgi:DNA invertase Pin-like site-specific DNA recombinase
MNDTYASRQRAVRDAEILTLLRSGRLTTERIADRCGVSKEVVQRVKKQAGLTNTGRRSRLTDEQREQARRLFEDGASQAEVARTLGCAPDQLKKAFPGRSWTVAQQIENSRIIGTRERMTPQLGPRKR